MQYWIGLGSNIGDGPAQITQALNHLESTGLVSVCRRSGCYRSAPWGVLDQPEFTNAVALLESDLGPLSLLDHLQRVEQAMGRRKDERRWGPRVIDLDLLLAGEQILRLKRLVLPHPQLHRRRFVLQPLAELEPDLRIPARGVVRHLLRRLPEQGVRLVSR